MRRSTTRRAVSTGLGALAATTALALAAPSAGAVTSSLVLDPGQDVLFSVSGYPADDDQLEQLDATPVPGSGEVRVALPALVQPGEPTAGLVDVDEFDDASGEGEFPATLVDVPVEVDGATGELVLSVPSGADAPVDDEGETVDDVYLVVDGLVVEGFDEAPSFQLVAPLDLDPRGVAELLVVDPAQLEGYLSAFAFVAEPVETQAGQSFAVELPESSSLGALGVEDLDDLGMFLLPLEDGDLDSLAEDMSAAGADGAVAQDVATALPAAQAALDAVAGDAAGRAADEDEDEDDGEDEGEEGADAVVLDDEDDLYPVVEADGRSATVTTSATLDAGDYLAVLLVSSSEELDVVAAAPVVVDAAAPAPAPSATVTQPAPTTTVTVGPPRQNPGLRSNTGVEDAAPGLSERGLVLLGSGLLAVAGVTTVAAARSSRRRS